MKVEDGWEFAQATPQLLPGQYVLALLVHFIQGPHSSSMEILKPQRPVTQGLIGLGPSSLAVISLMDLEPWPIDRQLGPY